MTDKPDRAMLIAARAKLLVDIKHVIAQYPDIKMTVRQVYYRLVVTQKVRNHQKEYNRVKSVLTDARLSGEIDYDDIEDRTRTVVEGEREEWGAKSFFDTYLDHFRKLDENYELPRWYGQPVKVVVMVEKQALEGIFKDVCEEAAVDLLVCKGYPSLSVLYQLSERLADQDAEEIKLLYFGDYDPSGLDIDRNVTDRLENNFDVVFEFERIAITREQIDQLGIPPAPAKSTDSRTRGMEEATGEAMQVELDAIDPPALKTLIEDAIEEHFDQDIYDNEREDELKKRQEEIKGYVEDILGPAGP